MSARLELSLGAGFRTHGNDGRKAIQIIYSHLPPAAVLAREQRLRNPTRLEQRTEQLWFGGKAGANGWQDWLRTERKLARKLCRALGGRITSKLKTS